MQETQVQSLGWEDPLGKEVATHSSILAWEIPWMEKPGRLQAMGPGVTKDSDMAQQQNSSNSMHSCSCCAESGRWESIMYRYLACV